ncbi:SGNH/GDSL hydrolase family protein [Synechococcus sp. CB0205]|uniref:SGNH/GDSL hydrolase family protein n=1 Tax=Synechococcus sp. CB0205 TaxID=232363 RepID=UPI0002DD5EB0|nr:SGNH/GDSL hydrolase family protein [Synechococcus sp. CB0205]
MKRWIANVAALSVGVTASLVFVEVGLRVAGLNYPAFYTVDAVRGFALRPGAQGEWTREGRGEVRINRAGFRGRDVDQSPAPRVLRIAVLGDSFTEALQVDEQQSFVQQLQERLASADHCSLRRKDSAGVEVLNFGVGAYGTGQQLLTWRHLARRYRPDWVLLVVYPGNDFTDNEPISRSDRPVFVLDAQNNLVVDQGFRQSAAYRWRMSLPGRALDGLVNHSRLLQLLNEAKNRWASRVQPDQEQSQSVRPQVPRTPVASDQAWRLTDHLIAALASEAQADQARFAVISTSAPEQVWPIASERPSQPFAQEQRLGSLLAKRQIPYLPLAPDLQRQADQAGLLLHGFKGQSPGEGHWNANGHRLAADLIAPWLCQL